MDYFAIYKPYGMISQFSPEGEHRILAELGRFKKDIYPVGRLDTDSEGLLLLTNDTRLNARLLEPRYGHLRCYHLQVEGESSQKAVDELKKGVSITINGKPFRTRQAEAKILDPSPGHPDRDPPIRERKTIPTHWLELKLSEGKNRQVRKMTASVGLPTLRLIRVGIEDLKLEGMEPGEVKRYSSADMYKLLRIS